MGINTPIADHSYESMLFRRRAVVAAVLCLLMLVGLLSRLAYLQVSEYKHFSSLSESNRIRLSALAPTRGLIYDRNGVLLAENRPTYHLEMVPEQIDDIEETIGALRDIIEITDQDIEVFKSRLHSTRSFESIPIRTRLDDEEVSRFAVNRHLFPGVDIEARLSRYYPHGPLMSHTIGYVGRISEKELKTLDKSNYSATTHIGKTGIERYYESWLHGQVGYQKIEVNSEGRVLQVVEKQSPVSGANLSLGIDIELQKVAEDAMGGKNGAVVAIDPKTGEVLVFVSEPTFDPNLFVHGISHKDYNRLQGSPDKPLYNRVVYGQYPPGSTYKPFIGLAGMENRVVHSDDHIDCIGYYQLPNDEDHRYRDWKKEGHGKVDMDIAIEESCDVYFYELSYRLGIDRMYEFLSRFNFGKKTGIDLYGERSGLLPSREWKRKVHKTIWYPGETVIAGIGQGYMLATPLQLASATATLATRGVSHQPRLVRQVRTAEGLVIDTDIEPTRRIQLRDPANWDRMHESMRRVVHGTWGTARLTGYGLKYKLAGKTGTAQVFSIGQDEEYDEETVAEKLRDHALFIGFAPMEDPVLAVAVVVENGEHGSKVAPVVRKIIDAYLKRRKG